MRWPSAFLKRFEKEPPTSLSEAVKPGLSALVESARRAKTPFEPYKGKYRKPGTGGVYQINDHLWEGKYSPRDAHGKRISRNVYAKNREECEAKLAVMIEEMKREIAAEKERRIERA